jgi:hypothetical protein
MEKHCTRSFDMVASSFLYHQATNQRAVDRHRFEDFFGRERPGNPVGYSASFMRW